MKRFCVVLFLFFIFSVFAQNATVFDFETKQPVFGVAYYNASQTKHGISNFDGSIDLSDFFPNETIYFQHASYELYSLTKSQIENNSNKVYINPGTAQLDEIVVSVTKFNQSRREVSSSIVGVRAEEAAFYMPQTSADLLSNTGQVFVQKSQLGGGSPMIRGFAANRLLISVDGVRMNTAIFRSGNMQNIISIDPFIIENTEVILGPGSVVYGSDAIGGVMNFYTLKPKFSFTDSISFSGAATTRFASANNEKTAHAHFNIGLENWAFLTSVTYNDFGHLRMGRHGPNSFLQPYLIRSSNNEDIQVENPNPRIQKPTGYNQLNLAQKVSYLPNEKLDVYLSLLYSETSNFSRYDRLTRTNASGNLRSAQWYYGPQRWFSSQLEFKRKSRNILFDDSKFVIAYQHFEESRNNRNVNSDLLFTNKENLDAISVNLDFSKKIKQTNLYYGMEYVFNKVNSYGSVHNISTNEFQPQATRYPDGATWHSLAAYAHFFYTLSPQLTMQSGLRYNHFVAKANFDSEFFDFSFGNATLNTGNINGSIGLNYKVNQSFSIRSSFSTAFRAPNIDDIGKVFDSEPGSVVVPNPDLKSEYSYTSEVGFKFNILNRIFFDIGTFYTQLENALVRRDYTLNGESQIIYQGQLSQVQAIQNASNAEVFGFEAAVKVQLHEHLQLSSNYTLAKGYETLEDGQNAPLRHAPPGFGNTRLVWNNSPIRLEANVHYSSQIRAENLAPSEQNKPEIFPIDANGNLYSPGWYTLNAVAVYQINSAWKISASLDNITDQRYRTYSSGITAAGRNFSSSLTYTF